ncbi:MAG TPA: pilus assembly protein [Acidiphilium sp.]|uniref:TadE/TadG family type IV pilus assembly protein n=1 Tax=unclassified Acidiphilium TaxID=2617493 RepID=UPI000BD9062B|nr:MULTISPECIES: TadE/TadG family type IV pilus assembly protein [unclassified Acidiphilium]OYV57754.1 MAG: pilus assembly protein TadE [Acidiphilium sp. 20-67-58]HQT60059.1 pilus assembly protein [Acidiphilium sp.]HQU10728.1 pilus assembly protein [Acidiphilium sp.]
MLRNLKHHRWVKQRQRSLSMKGFASDTRGAAAVEFALVAIPYFALIFAIIQSGLIFFSQEVLQNATQQTARLIMTGQAQTSGMTAQQFLQDVCAEGSPLLTCASLNVNVQTFPSFSAITQVNPVVNGNFNTSTLLYSLGGPGDIVLVQVFYQLPVFAGPLNFSFATVNGSQRLLEATAVFRNEPY